MKKIFSLLIIVISLSTQAQVKSVNLQASGLTCSMCSNAINKALKTIPYVDKVIANIRNSSFEITFKPGSQVNFDDLKNKVEDAGFSVAGLDAVIDFNNISIKNDEHINIDGMLLHFMNVSDQALTGTHTIKLLDKGFVPAKEYKKNARYTKMDCYKTGVAGACCTKSGVAAGTRVYHVTI